MRASFNGDIPEIPGIAVDNFEDTGKRAYFLSHCHGDHTTGLKNLFRSINSTKVLIYMSEPSAAIVQAHIDEKLNEFIKPLQLGTTTITLPADDKNDLDESYIGVTLIPASHCFGSVMFLFETTLNKILYTGDFRISENSVSKIAKLHDDTKKPIKLDTLYVDTTFQKTQYETFPKRSETINGVVREIEKWLKLGSEHRIALVPSARYGYEYVLNEIYKRMDMKVFVENNWDLYSKFLGKQLTGVTNEATETKIHLCSKRRKYCNTCYTDIYHKYLYINFSAWKWNNFDSEDLPVVFEPEDNRVDVCFATHCSRSELMYFVEYLSPKKIVGFPDPYMYIKDPCVVTPSKRKSPKQLLNQSDDVQPKKVPKYLLKQIFE